MSGFCDLHTHSDFSDGTLSPVQIIEEACRKGLSAVALTDHNTILGLPAFLKAAQGKNIRAVPGIEISTGYRGKEVHIVGLFIEPEQYDAVMNFVNVINQRKEESNRKLIQNLAEAGMVLDYEEMKKNHTGNINRAVIAAELTAKGYVRDNDDAFAGVLSRKAGYFIPPERIPALEAIAFLRSIHAVPVLAHPYLSLTEEELRSFLPEAGKQGLTAMETCYSKYSEETTVQATRLAEEFALLGSGGSDFHGDNKKEISLGCVQVPCQNLDALSASI